MTLARCTYASTFVNHNAVQMLQMVQMLVGGQPSNYDSQWVSALIGILVGQLAAVQALQFGLQLALVVWSYHAPSYRSEPGIAGGHCPLQKDCL